ncbi:MAG: AAA family ATPase [Hyphomicrobium sp.]|uniref:AAA family ATPase n=1 Tax=Hyphomicrobium sp. TaxID=82 RepID=UPI0039E52B5D
MEVGQTEDTSPGESAARYPNASWTMKRAAQFYASQGKMVFPVGTDKLPLIKEWPKAASSDRAQIDWWWSKWPDANIGVLTGPASNLAVIDIDVKDGKGGKASAEALEDAHGEYASGLMVSTPSGGSHHWYEYSEAPFNSNAGKAGEAIDLRSGNADGSGSGYVLAAPSTVDGKRYVWIRTDTDTPSTIPDGLALALCFSKVELAVIASTPGLRKKILVTPRTSWRDEYNLARTFSTCGLQRLASGAKPRTDLDFDTPYIATTIEAELTGIARALKDQNDNLSRRSASLGTLLGGMGIASGSADAEWLKKEIKAAALSMRALDPSRPWNDAAGRRAIDATVDGQFEWGLLHPRDLSHVNAKRARVDDDCRDDGEGGEADAGQGDAAKSERPRNTRIAQLLSMADVEAKPVEWLWPKRIPKGALSIIAGDPSQGKSQITCYMSATVSTGGAWIDDERNRTREAQSVILLNAEDAAENVIKPRLIAAGADVSKVFTIKSVLRYDEKGNPTETDVSLAQDIQTLDAVLSERRDVGLVIIDPISAYLGKVDSHNNSEVRGILAPLARLAEKHNVAIVCVSHLNKGNGGKVTDRVTGSLAFSAAARAVYLVGASPEEGADETTKMFVAGKTNLAPNVEALSFKIDGHQVMTSDGPIETSRVQWLEALPMTADDVLRGKDEKRDGRKEGREGLETFLSKYLADGYRHPFEKIEEAARRAGHDKSKSTFLRAARTIGVEIKRPSVGGAGSEWQLSARH